MNNFNKIIEDKIDEYIENGSVYKDIFENGVRIEKKLEEELNSLFLNYGYDTYEYSINIEHVYDYIDLDIFTIYVAYIDKTAKFSEKLKVINKVLYRD